jgi:hypothetical protein
MLHEQEISGEYGQQVEATRRHIAGGMRQGQGLDRAALGAALERRD